MRDKDCILIENCINGNLYRIRSRNLFLGVWDEKVKGFIGIREKFGSRFLATEYHWDTGAPFGTASPLEDLGESPVFELSEKSKELFDWLEIYEANWLEENKEKL